MKNRSEGVSCTWKLVHVSEMLSVIFKFRRETMTVPEV